MADDLDALFGAFDGDAEAPKDEPSTNKMKAASGPAVEDHVNGDAALEALPPDAEAPAGAPTNGKSSVYTNIMAQRTASHLRQQEDDSEAEKKETTGKSEKVEDDTTKEIATGTSHDKSVRSYSAYPKNLPPGAERKASAPTSTTPAKEYAFTLDPFQSRAVSYVDKDESVLVAAHTSAGKTAVAEYAVAKSLRDGQRVVYTSPIKALSNQKFRDLQEEFQDVGLMTGDITINPTATCLVMTTEILRSMLYRGSELMREVAWGE